MRQALRDLPSVEILASRADKVPRKLAIAAARTELEELRRRFGEGEDLDLSEAALDAAVLARAKCLSNASLRSVINATGVILHTNLGRAPLAPEAAEAAAVTGASYTNLEYDLVEGRRGSRQAHIEPLLCSLTGAEAALAVNNNAAAVMLALAALAAPGEVVVSRGQLIEIGDSFRIPDILACSGAHLVEVGTTNRTRIADYEGAIGPKTRALMRVHQSNFRTVGFTEEVSLEELCELGRHFDLPIVDDLGSGALAPIEDEPTVSASVSAGVAVVCCSADKLLGGPQAGLVLGRAESIERCCHHPLARALRIDAMQLAALEATLRLHRFDGGYAIPTLAMLGSSREVLEERARRLAAVVGERASVTIDASRPGGGSLPRIELEGPVCAIDPRSAGADALAAALRHGEVPVIARISDQRVLLDPRTIDDADTELVGRLVLAALR